MKIIISHDVDHLYRNDHYKDLIYPKLWVRETIACIRRKISISQWGGRIAGTFRRERTNIEDVIRFDVDHGVKSSFYFGMANGLGMSYSQDKVPRFVALVEEAGYEAGVHGIAFNDPEKMHREFSDFCNLIGKAPKGVRMHYVRYDDTTFELLNECGYVYDTTKFVKSEGCCIENPYKVGEMWEFPLCLMDGYLPGTLDKKKQRTLELLNVAEGKELKYFTALFHDTEFCDAYSYDRDWYIWFIEYLREKKYEFISYQDAVKELEGKSYE